MTEGDDVMGITGKIVWGSLGWIKAKLLPGEEIDQRLVGIARLDAERPNWNWFQKAVTFALLLTAVAITLSVSFAGGEAHIPMGWGFVVALILFHLTAARSSYAANERIKFTTIWGGAFSEAAYRGLLRYSFIALTAGLLFHIGAVIAQVIANTGNSGIAPPGDAPITSVFRILGDYLNMAAIIGMLIGARDIARAHVARNRYSYDLLRELATIMKAVFNLELKDLSGIKLGTNGEMWLEEVPPGITRTQINNAEAALVEKRLEEWMLHPDTTPTRIGFKYIDDETQRRRNNSEETHGLTFGFEDAEVSDQEVFSFRYTGATNEPNAEEQNR